MPVDAIDKPSTQGSRDPKRRGTRTDKAEKDFMATARKRLQIAIESTSINRVYQNDDLRFAAGSPDNKYQWPEPVLRSREGGGAIPPRPTLTINKLPQHIHQITNEQRQNRPVIKVLPVDDKGDKEVAEILGGMVRHIEYMSDADAQYSTAGESQVQHGEGYLRVLTDYCDEMSFEQDITIQGMKNSFSVYLDPIGLLRDPTGRYCEWGYIVEDMPKDEYVRQYPKADTVNWELVGQGDEWKAWFPDNDTVRVAEYFYYEHEEMTLCEWPDGSKTLKEEMNEGLYDELAKLGIVPVNERRTDIKKVKWCKMNGLARIEERDWAGKYIPIVRIIGNEWFIDGKTITSGIVRNAKDAQRMFNYWKSTETEMLALAPKSPFTGPAEAFEGYEDDWKDANTKPIAFLKYNQFGDNGEKLDRPMREQAPMPPIGIVNAALGAADDIKSATGQYDPSLGNNPQAKSGIALQREQRKSDVGTFHYIDNQARGVKQLGRLLIDLIPRTYDTKRIARVMGEDEKVDHVMLDPSQQQAVMEQPNERGGIDKIYNPSIGRYDVMVSVGPGYASKRQEASDLMARVLQGQPELMAKMGDLYFEMLDVPGADKIAARLRKMLPPGLAEEDEDGDDAPPMVQTPEGPLPVDAAGQMLTQMGMQIQELNERLQKADEAGAQAKIADAETKRMAQEADAAAKARELEIKAYEAETKRMDAQCAMRAQEHAETVAAHEASERADVHEDEMGMERDKEAAAAAASAKEDEARQTAERDTSNMEAMLQAMQEHQQMLEKVLKVATAPRKSRLIEDKDGNPIESISEVME